MDLLVLRSIFILVASGIGIFIIRWSGVISENMPASTSLGVFFGILGTAIAIILADVSIRRKELQVISAVYFGLIVGLLLAYLAGFALTPLFPEPYLADGSADRMRQCVQLVLAVCLCYICISLLLQTRSDFRFIIPYVEFAREVKGNRPLILDTSVVIDGRIADVVETGFLDNQLVMPRFAIAELQKIADSADRARRNRGRRGLDILQRLQNYSDIDFRIDNSELPEFNGQSVDMKLVLLAKHLEGKLVTNDYNLNKVSKLHGVPVVNLNDLANSVKQAYLPGEQLEVHIVKPGEEAGQGVAYLDDGTMVVVESGRPHVNKRIGIEVTSVIQTSAGRMVFGRFDRVIGAPTSATKKGS